MCSCWPVQTQERDSFGHYGFVIPTEGKTPMKCQIIVQSTESKSIILLPFLK